MSFLAEKLLNQSFYSKNMPQIHAQFIVQALVDLLGPISQRDLSPGADFTKGLKPRLTLKCKTLVLNFLNRMVIHKADFTKQLSP